jgi:hypothetical protein
MFLISFFEENDLLFANVVSRLFHEPENKTRTCFDKSAWSNFLKELTYFDLVKDANSFSIGIRPWTFPARDSSRSFLAAHQRSRQLSEQNSRLCVNGLNSRSQHLHDLFGLFPELSALRIVNGRFWSVNGRFMGILSLSPAFSWFLRQIVFRVFKVSRRSLA